MRQIICVFTIALAAAHTVAAPLSFREVEFLVRQAVPEVEIIAEVKSRRVLDVPAPEQLAALRAQGASAHLIATLQLPEVKLSAEEAAAYEQLRKAQLEQAATQPAADDAPRKIIQQTIHVAPDELASKRPLRQFGHYFVYLREKESGARPQGNQVFLTVPQSDIKDVRMFILFSNAHDSPRRTAFTARMIELYPKWKERYRDFEVVVVDSTSPGVLGFREFAADHLRWPTAFYLEFDDTLRKAIPRRFPSLLPVNAAGVSLSTKKLGSIEGDLAEVERLLELGHRR